MWSWELWGSSLQQEEKHVPLYYIVEFCGAVTPIDPRLKAKSRRDLVGNITVAKEMWNNFSELSEQKGRAQRVKHELADRTAFTKPQQDSLWHCFINIGVFLILSFQNQILKCRYLQQNRLKWTMIASLKTKQTDHKQSNLGIGSLKSLEAFDLCNSPSHQWNCPACHTRAYQVMNHFNFRALWLVCNQQSTRPLIKLWAENKIGNNWSFHVH